MKRFRIVLADDQPEILTFLKLALGAAFDVVGTAEDGRTLIAEVHRLSPDVVLTDINMPVMDGIEATRELLKTNPYCVVICHSSHNEPSIQAAARSAGASGYLIKGMSNNLVASIQSIISHARSPHADFDLTNRRLAPLHSGSRR